jgi:hypothetical protein
VAGQAQRLAVELVLDDGDNRPGAVSNFGIVARRRLVQGVEGEDRFPNLFQTARRFLALLEVVVAELLDEALDLL